MFAFTIKTSSLLSAPRSTLKAYGSDAGSETKDPIPTFDPELSTTWSNLYQLRKVLVRYAVATSLTTGGLVTFGVLGYHLTTRHVIATSALPIAYAGAMAIEALAALAVSAAYDRHGARVLLLVPLPS